MCLKAMFPSITPRVNEYQWAQSRCAIFGAATGKKALFQDPSIHNLLDKKNVILQKLLKRRKFIGHNHRVIIVGTLCTVCTDWLISFSIKPLMLLL